MVWRQGQSYSEDLRARVLAAIDGGMAARSAAQVFRVSVSYIYKALIRRRRTGEVSASSRRGHRPRKLTPEQEATLAAHIAAHPDITLAALQTPPGCVNLIALVRRLTRICVRLAGSPITCGRCSSISPPKSPSATLYPGSGNTLRSTAIPPAGQPQIV
jgi:D-serine deaminase-like pyridoxal phosphate-dependent protein